MSADLPAGTAARHVAQLCRSLDALTAQTARLTRWGRLLAETTGRGGRLLAAGNGGSAAEAQHLTAELVGRFRDDRQPFSAIALHADTSSLTAIGNDYGYQDVFARQVLAHGRERDLLVLLSTSGRSANLLNAARTAGEIGVTVLAMTGSAPNPLAGLADDALCVPGAPVHVQESHLVAVHVLCTAFEAALAPRATARRAS